jgi:hypothetical protein
VYTYFHGTSAAVPAKWTFSDTQFSTKITTLNSDLHVTYYTEKSQQGSKSEYGDTYLNECLATDALSVGVYTS